VQPDEEAALQRRRPARARRAPPRLLRRSGAGQVV